MPAYYVSWSRFTELAGLVAAPGCCWSDGSALAARPRWRPVAATAALVLVHPRVLLMALALGGADLLLDRPAWAGPGPGAPVRALAIRALVAGAAAGLPPCPGRFTWPARLLFLSVTAPGVEAANALDLTAISTAHDPWVYGLAAAAAVAGALTGPGGGRVAILWLGLVGLAANPAWLGLPGSYMLSNGAVVIALWLPAAALAGGALAHALGQLAAFLARRPLPGAALVTRHSSLVTLLAALALSNGAAATLKPGAGSGHGRRSTRAGRGRRCPASRRAGGRGGARVAARDVHGRRRWLLRRRSDAWASDRAAAALRPGAARAGARDLSEELAEFEQVAQTDPRALAAQHAPHGGPSTSSSAAARRSRRTERAALASSSGDFEPLVAEGEARLYRLRRP